MTPWQVLREQSKEVTPGAPVVRVPKPASEDPLWWALVKLPFQYLWAKHKGTIGSDR